MKNRRFFLNGMFVIAVAGSLTSCIDDTYDMSKEIDMTVGLGAKGLKLNLGNTEEIKLADVLEVDEEEMLEQTSEGLFYLIKDGDASNFTFDVPSFKATVDVASLTPELPMLKFDDFSKGANINQLPVKGDWKSPKLPLSVASTELFSVSNLPKEIKNLKRIIPQNDSRDVTVSLEIVSNTTSQKFVVDTYENVKVTLPKFFKLKKDGVALEKNEITIPNKTNVNKKSVTLAEFTVEALELDGEKGFDLTDKNTLDILGEYEVQGDFSIKASENFTIKQGDETTIRVIIKVGNQASSNKVNISFAEVEGVFNPDIDPNIKDINIGNDVPEFLKDEEVCIKAANPTFRLSVDMSQVPVNLTLWGNLYAKDKANQNMANVRIPGANKVALHGAQKSVIYFCQEAEPFDPNGIAPNSTTYNIGNLNDLVEKIPHKIKVDMDDNKIQLTDELTKIQLGKTFNASVDYSVYVPFKFNQGMKIVYTEDIEDLGGDLEDLAADGAKITALIDNKVPLELNLTAEVMDAKGKIIPGVEVSSIKVPASAVSNIEITIKFSNPYDLQKLDRLSLKVTAETGTGNATLTSKQSIQLQNLTLELLGQIIADLN